MNSTDSVWRLVGSLVGIQRKPIDNNEKEHVNAFTFVILILTVF